MEPERNPWTVLSAEVAYENRWIRVTHHDVLTPSGTEGIYGVVHFKNRAICIVPVDEDGWTWLVGQYRFATDSYSWELPEGGAPLDEDPLAGAQRELREEVGLLAREWTLVGSSYLSNSVSDEHALIYLARGLVQADTQPEETEQLRIRHLPFSEVVAMVDSGEIEDAFTVMAVLQVLHKKLI